MLLRSRWKRWAGKPTMRSVRQFDKYHAAFGPTGIAAGAVAGTVLAIMELMATPQQ